jgi:hypothetical protein
MKRNVYQKISWNCPFKMLWCGPETSPDVQAVALWGTILVVMLSFPENNLDCNDIVVRGKILVVTIRRTGEPSGLSCS